jgi:hypothetical protein
MREVYASALCAAALFAIFASEPQIEGFTVNGELLATLPTVAAVAALPRAQSTTHAGSWLYLAGFCAGSALLIKQSALDAAVIVLLFALLGRPTGWHAHTSRFALVAGGLATAVALSAIHGAVTGMPTATWREETA